MTYFYFSKAILDFTEVVLVFEQGKLGMPVCILQEQDIIRINKEWEKVVK